MRKKDSQSENVEASVSIQRPPISHSNSIWLLRKPLVDEPGAEPGKEPGKEQPGKEQPGNDQPGKSVPSRPTRARSMTTSNFWPGRMNTKDEPPCPPPKQRTLTASPTPSRAGTVDGTEGKNFDFFFVAELPFELDIN